MPEPLLVDLHGQPLTGKRYAAAQPTRLGQTWRPIRQDINTMISRSAPIIRERVSQLVRDFPPFVSALKRIETGAIGDGLDVRFMVRLSDGTFDRKQNKQLREAFMRWRDEADPRGLQHYYDLEALSMRQRYEMGEFICVAGYDMSPNRFLPLTIRFYESDWLTSDGACGEDGQRLTEALAGVSSDSMPVVVVYDGIEYNRLTGVIQAYHLREPGSRGKPARVPARYVAHGFDVLRANQLRGISPFAPAVMLAHDLSEYMDAEMDATQMASKWLGFVYTDNPANRFVNGGGSKEPDGQRIEHVENAILEYLRPGEKIEFASANRPGNNFEPFIKLVLRLVAVTIGISYESLAGDHSDVNYSTLKGIRNDEAATFAPIRNRHDFQFKKPVNRWFMDALYLSGRCPMPGYASDPWRYLNYSYLAPSQQQLDPLKESQADDQQLQSRVTSRTRIAAKYGEDIEDILDELAEEEALIKERGLSAAQLDAAMSGKKGGTDAVA